MKFKKTIILSLTLAILVTAFIPVSAKEPIAENAYSDYISPRYSYIINASLSVTPSSSQTNYKITVSAISKITSISGTLKLYKQNSSGKYEKKESQSVSCSGSRLNTTGSFSSYGSGNYRLTFDGKVAGSGISEPITISAENSY